MAGPAAPRSDAPPTQPGAGDVAFLASIIEKREGTTNELLRRFFAQFDKLPISMAMVWKDRALLEEVTNLDEQDELPTAKIMYDGSMERVSRCFDACTVLYMPVEPNSELREAIGKDPTTFSEPFEEGGRQPIHFASADAEAALAVLLNFYGKDGALLVLKSKNGTASGVPHPHGGILIAPMLTYQFSRTTEMSAPDGRQITVAYATFWDDERIRGYPISEAEATENSRYKDVKHMHMRQRIQDRQLARLRKASRQRRKQKKKEEEEADIDLDVSTEPETESEPESESESEPESEPETGAETGAESESGPGSDAGPEPDSGSDAGSEPDSDSGSEPDSEPEPEPDSEPDSDSDPESEDDHQRWLVLPVGTELPPLPTSSEEDSADTDFERKFKSDPDPEPEFAIDLAADPLFVSDYGIPARKDWSYVEWKYGPRGTRPPDDKIRGEIERSGLNPDEITAEREWTAKVRRYEGQKKQKGQRKHDRAVRRAALEKYNLKKYRTKKRPKDGREMNEEEKKDAAMAFGAASAAPSWNDAGWAAHLRHQQGADAMRAVTAEAHLEHIMDAQMAEARKEEREMSAQQRQADAIADYFAGVEKDDQDRFREREARDDAGEDEDDVTMRPAVTRARGGMDDVTMRPAVTRGPDVSDVKDGSDSDSDGATESDDDFALLDIPPVKYAADVLGKPKGAGHGGDSKRTRTSARFAACPHCNRA